jgi:mannose-6-phosphate isomerase-like protein (cupin superfamily)
MILNCAAREHLRGMEEQKRAIATRTRRLVVSSSLKLLDFSNKDEKGFVEYEPGIFIRDITSVLGKELGLTSLHVMVKTDCIIDPHEHITQSQTFMVRTGKIQNLNDDNNPFYHPNDTFFVRKNQIHHLKYFAGSEYLITFKPQLNETDD